jgi:hypothetical protein
MSLISAGSISLDSAFKKNYYGLFLGVRKIFLFITKIVTRAH